MSMYTSIKNAALTFFRSRHIIPLFTVFCAIILSSQSFGQSGDIDQIRNGPATDPSKNFYKTFNNPTWVNGNAGSSNAHYVEGHSIAYRSLITGLTVGNQYEYIIEWDTKNSDAMAIDYITHFQRLEPHSQFTPAHSAEVINPRIYISNGKEYQLGLSAGTNPNTFDIPEPGPVPTPVANLPQNSFKALTTAERKFTIYNGTITNMAYISQGPLNTSASKITTSMKIRFTAAKDSVVLAWGGHIASRLDWGFINGKPRSAGGISGSPYHMRQISMNTFPGLVNISGVGNTDRSLAAAAVIPPPDCPTVPSQTICAGGSFGTFTIASPQSGTTYTWSFGTNTAGAAFTGGGSTATGNSVTVVKSGGGSFTSGSFTLNIVALQNGLSRTCNGVASGTVEVTAVNATASPTLIDITSSGHSTTLTANIDASSTDADNTHYDYVWSIITGAGSLSATNTRVVTYTADAADAGSKLAFKVVATQKNDNDATTPECSAEDTVQVDVNTAAVCGVSAAGPVCEAATVTHNGTPNPIPANATYTWSLEANGGGGSTTSTLSGSNGGTSIDVIANASYRIKLSQTYANTALNQTCFKDVTVTPTPSVTTQYNAPSCSEKTFTVDVTNPVNGLKYSATQPGNPSNSIGDITPSQGSPNVHFTGLTAGDGYTITVSTIAGAGSAACSATSECETNPDPPAQNSVVDPTNATKNKEVKKANDLNKVSDNVTDTYTITLPSGTSVKPLPNPYTDKVRFNLVSGVSGLATLEIHNVLGQKIAVVYQGHIQAGVEISKEFYVPSKDRGTLIYTFRVGEQKVSGKLVPIR
jgi:hypothetical protein